MTWIYLDTSVAVHALRGAPAVECWWDEVHADPDRELVSSRLLQTELTRVLRRDGRPVVERGPIIGQLGLVPITEAILTAAEAITVHLKTLDAIHLATALAFGSGTVIATHDAALKAAADAVGLAWTDPVVTHG